jgi:hypothetical protein
VSAEQALLDTEDELEGTWETLSLSSEEGVAFVERRDVWGISDPTPPNSPLGGLRFG